MITFLLRLLAHPCASPTGVREDHDLIEVVAGRSSVPVRDDVLAPLLVAWHDECSRDGA